MKAAQSAGRSAVATVASPATGGRCLLRLGAGAGLVPRDGMSRPQDAPPLGATARLPAAWLSQWVTCYAKPCQADLCVPACAHLLGARASPHPEDRPPACRVLQPGTSRYHHHESQVPFFSLSEPTLERKWEAEKGIPGHAWTLSGTG